MTDAIALNFVPSACATQLTCPCLSHYTAGGFQTVRFFILIIFTWILWWCSRPTRTTRSVYIIIYIAGYNVLVSRLKISVASVFHSRVFVGLIDSTLKRDSDLPLFFGVSLCACLLAWNLFRTIAVVFVNIVHWGCYNIQ